MEHAAPTWLVNSFMYLSAAVIAVPLSKALGLGREPQRLWSLRRRIFGWGSAQVLGCALALTALAVLDGAPWKTALVGGLGLALSARTEKFQSTPGIEAGRSPALLTARRRTHFPRNIANLKCAASKFRLGAKANCVMSMGINGLHGARTSIG